MEKVFYNRSAEQTLGDMDSSRSGLSGEEAAARLQKYGQNALAEANRKSVVEVFFSQFKDLLVVILLAAAVISLLSGNVESTVVIFAVLILNAVLGTVQHCKAEKSLQSLKAMSSPSAKVIRGGTRMVVSSTEIVPGDIVELEAGDMIVADGRILENYSLKVNESSLTGESEGVEKTADVLTGGKVALGDQKNMVFSGSLVTYGRAVMVVTATGMHTEIGKTAALMNQTQQRKTPLQISLDDFSRRLAIIILVICVGVFALSLYHADSTGFDAILDSLMFAVALAVAAIPEALSSIVTIVQAMGTQKMARQNAIIKELKAVETLGAVSVICSDKTGTLTQNKMTPQKIYADDTLLDEKHLDLANDVQRLLLKAALLASDATTDEETGEAIGDPTEVALVMIGDRLGVEESAYRDQHPRLGELAFDSDRKLMSTLHDIEGTSTMYTKGAIDVLLDRSEYVLTSDGPVPMTEEWKTRIAQVNLELSQEGLRVLAFAQRELDAIRPLTLEDEHGFTFIGLVSMIDPPRPEAIQAVADAARGGVRTIMITGDHKITATAIARQIGIFRDGDEALSGVELDDMTDEELDAHLEHISVYARVSPEHKIRIVEAWQRKGKIVSMTGDGVNDAPALKAADVGIAMGSGTDVAKEAADMILLDDNFSTIVTAVEEGRRVYSNIRKSLYSMLGCNFSALTIVLFSLIFGWGSPVTALQLLIIKVACDGIPGFSLCLEKADPDIMQKPPVKKGASIFSDGLITKIVEITVVFTVATLIPIWVGMHCYLGGGIEPSFAVAQTMTFFVMGLTTIVHVYNCRSRYSAFRRGMGVNKLVVGTTLLGTVVMIIITAVPPVAELFSLVPLGPWHWALMIALSVTPLLYVELMKALGRFKTI